jgi:hypothetical protein
MVVVIGGMIRSGSTFSFNIVKEILAQTGTVEISFANSIDSSVFSRADNQHFILKTHSPDEDILARIKNSSLHCVCTIRRPEDSIASFIRTFGFPLELGIESVKHWFDWYHPVSNLVLSIDYGIIDLQPRLAIAKIVEYIGLGGNEALAEALAERYEKSTLKTRFDSLTNDERTVDVGCSYYERETFFHRRHISSLNSRSAALDLSPIQIDQIRNELRGQYLKLDTANVLRAGAEFLPPFDAQ